MSRLTIQQRNALRYASTKAHGDREARAAESLMHAQSTTPSLQRFVESPRGQAVMLLVGLAIFAMFAPVGTF